MTAYDGRRGAFVGSVNPAKPGVVSTSAGRATLETDSATDSAKLIAFVPPHRNLASIHVQGYVEEVLDLGAGAFAYRSPDGIFAFDAHGAPRWSRKGKFGRVEVRGAAARVVHLIDSDHWTVVAAADGSEVLSLPVKTVVPTDEGGVFSNAEGLYRRDLSSSGGPEPIPLETSDSGTAGLEVRGVSPKGRYVAFGHAHSGTIIRDFHAHATSTLGDDASLRVAWAENDVPRVAITSKGGFDVRSGSLGDKPLFVLGSPDSTAKFEEVGGTSFAAQCENGKTATLGRVVALPASFTKKDVSTPQELTFSDGVYRVSSNERQLTLTRTSDDKERAFDVGSPAAEVDRRPNHEELVVASHYWSGGMGYHPDPGAKIRIFDLKTGALVKTLRGLTFRFSESGARLVVEDAFETVLYDATTYRRLRSWAGPGNDVWLGPSERFAVVYIRRLPSGGLGPLEMAASFVEALGSSRRVVDLQGHEGLFAFDTTGSRLAFGPATEGYLEARSIAVYDLTSGKVTATVDVDEAAERVAFLDRDLLFGVWTKERLVLHRISDGREVSLHAVSDGEACRLFAVDDRGRFQGDPGGRLGFRYGDDLRTSEIVTTGPEFDAHRDDALLETFFAAPR